VELQDDLSVLKLEGISPFTISYDPEEVLAEFADRHGITYPLLSNVGSKVIRDFGILNTAVPEDHPKFGVPLPGTYMVGEDGKVFDRSFHAYHIQRNSIASMMQESFHVTKDVARGTFQIMETHVPRAFAWISADTVRRGQMHTLNVQLDIRLGYQIHGRPPPDGYIATLLKVDPVDDVVVSEAVYPVPAPIHLAAIDETLNVYAGSIVLKATVLSRHRKSFTLGVTLAYQTCDDRECLLPDELTFTLPLEYRDSPKRSNKESYSLDAGVQFCTILERNSFMFLC
jgi:hypothetical protein